MTDVKIKRPPGGRAAADIVDPLLTAQAPAVRRGVAVLDGSMPRRVGKLKVPAVALYRKHQTIQAHELLHGQIVQVIITGVSYTDGDGDGVATIELDTEAPA